MSKQFYKFIRPGAIRVESTTASDELLSLAFNNSGSYKLFSISIDKGRTEKEIILPLFRGKRYINIGSELLNCKLQKISGNNNVKIPAQSIETVTRK